ncbi:cupin domain-containing protein [Anaerotignum sp.]|uniref:cupin domain-containing protein n=1 Tax=Anaerotignum sp. TaxID=2039241 RepID=UPI002ED3E70A
MNRNDMRSFLSGMPNITDYGPEPFVVNIDMVTKQNPNYRTALWTGNNLQLTLMSIPPGGDIGLEIHPNVDQFIRVEDGVGVVQMGSSKDKLNYQRNVDSQFGIFVPAGTWHNLINIGNKPLKVYTIYAPPHHPSGTVQATKQAAQEAEDHEH